MTRIIRSPDGEIIDLDAPPPSIDKLCSEIERIFRELRNNEGFINYMRNKYATKIRNEYITKRDIEELEKEVRRNLDQIET